MPAKQASNWDAIARARAAYERMVERKRQAVLVRRARDRARNIRLALVSASLLALLLGVCIYQGWMPTLPSAPVSARQAAINQFGAKKTGQVRTPVKGDTCRELAFNNEIGRFVGENTVPCDDLPAPQKAQSAAEPRVNPLFSIRDRFAK